MHKLKNYNYFLSCFNSSTTLTRCAKSFLCSKNHLVRLWNPGCRLISDSCSTKLENKGTSPTMERIFSGMLQLLVRTWSQQKPSMSFQRPSPATLLMASRMETKCSKNLLAMSSQIGSRRAKMRLISSMMTQKNAIQAVASAL